MEQTEHQNEIQTEDIELELLLEAIFKKFGYDFRDYNKAHVKRRILQRKQSLGLRSLSDLQHKTLHEKGFIDVLLRDLSINVTEMYRDPSFYAAMRNEVLPILKTYPYIKIWHAGCATGEEVYSFAIMLKEEGLYHRTQIYATDFNPVVLETARKGIYPISKIKEFTANYQQAGGTHSFSEYYLAKYDSAILNQNLRENIVFAEHNLVTDSVFAEVHLIVCRNVLIYFNKTLQNRVLQIFSESLIKGGYLGLGSKENIMFTDIYPFFETLDSKNKIYKKKVHLP
ncbi:MAG: protein-glutamate O-methyltransferase CheR [Bacteroidales bacterium]|nr:protein-glutamate O-methyltransferase CheR [Bacteroidales bacterium]